MLLSGRKLTAQEACGKGLVSQVFWPGTFTQEVMVRIKELAACNPVVCGICSFICVTFFYQHLFQTPESSHISQYFPSPPHLPLHS